MGGGMDGRGRLWGGNDRDGRGGDSVDLLDAVAGGG
jgi:hypothetical protein